MYSLWFKALDESSIVATTSSGGSMIATINCLNGGLHVGISNFFIHYYCNCMSYDDKIELFGS